MISNDIEILQESLRRQEHAINVYKPSILEHHNQTSYHKSNARYRLLFGGNQSGKSHAAAFDCAINARGRNEYLPESNITGRDVEIWVISAEYSTIKTGIYRHLKNIIPSWDIIAYGPRIPGHALPSFLRVRRKDGHSTIITFLSSKGGEDARGKFQAAAIDWFYIDEEITGDIWEELEARTLATGGHFSISATLVESYQWIVDLEKRAERGDPYVFLTRLNTELNPYLHKETVELLKKTFSKETLEYRYYGRSRAATGLIYSSFSRDKHVVKPFKIPYNWPRYCAIDPGIRTCAVLWIAVGPNNRAYGYRHIYAHGEPLWGVAKEIKIAERWEFNEPLSFQFSHYVWEATDESEHMLVRLIDPKSRARSEAGEDSIINQLYERYGLSCIPADNAVRPGLEDCRYWLEPLEDGEPGFVVFDTLTDFIDEILVYRNRPAGRKKNQNDPIEDPIRKANHLMDCWRYIAREKPIWKDHIRVVNFQPKGLQKRDIEEDFDEGITSEVLGCGW